MLTLRSLPILLLLLIPSGVYLSHFDDMPQFGDLQDDGVYYASAKSLADGGTYRIESLPGEPAQTKFPPLYPLLLSIAWRIDPHFPDNLRLAAWISWLALPAVLFLSAAYLPKLGVTGWRAWLLLCLLAINPYVVFYSSHLMTELPFLALILCTMLMVERSVEGEGPFAWPVAAGVVAGLTYLTRSAGIAMLPAAIAYLGFRRQWRKAIWFTAAMAPFIAGWMLWARIHQVHTADSALMHYTDYFGYEIYTLKRVGLGTLLWKNIDGLLWGLGSLLQPKFANSQFLKILASVMAVAMISGVVRIVRRGHGMLYALFAAGSSLILIVYFYPPDERLVVPFLPLAFAGLLVEIEHLAGMLRAGLRQRDFSQRIAAYALAAPVTIVLVWSVVLEISFVFVYLPDAARAQRLTNADRIAAYRWITANLPAQANLLTGTNHPLTFGQNDQLLFLYTGRHAINDMPPMTYWYWGEQPRIVDWVSHPGPFARAHGLQYFEFEGADTSRQGSEDRVRIERVIAENPDYTALYRRGAITIYGLRSVLNVQ